MEIALHLFFFFDKKVEDNGEKEKSGVYLRVKTIRGNGEAKVLHVDLFLIFKFLNIVKCSLVIDLLFPFCLELHFTPNLSKAT